jgi:hypothetical protein
MFLFKEASAGRPHGWHALSLIDLVGEANETTLRKIRSRHRPREVARH